MAEVILPVIDGGAPLSRALWVLKASGRTGLVVVDAEGHARLLEVDDLASPFGERDAKKVRDVAGGIKLTPHSHGAETPSVRVEGPYADVYGLDDATAARLYLAISWYACASGHTYSPSQYKRLKISNGVRVCDVDGQPVN